MSVARTMEAMDYDLALLKEAAVAAGFSVQMNPQTGASLYGQAATRRYDLSVFSPKHHYAMNFKQKGNKVDMTYDGDGETLVKRDMAHEILPRYAEVMLAREHGTHRFKFESRKKVGTKTRVTVQVR